MKKISLSLKVKNALGLHTRPATTIAKLLQNTHSSVHFTYNKLTINAKSIMGLLLLSAPHQAKIKIDIEGPDADEILEKLTAAFDNYFGDQFHVS